MNIVAACPIEEGRPDAVASLEADLDALGEVLHAVVHTGAGVSFVVPFAVEEARAFWLEKVLPGVIIKPFLVLIDTSKIVRRRRTRRTGRKCSSCSCIRRRGAAASLAR